VTATAKSGYTFANWTQSGVVVWSSASYTFTLTGSRTLVANFKQNTVNCTISLSASPSAGGTWSGNGTFPSGSSRTVTATAKSGYTFANWTQSGIVVWPSASYTFTLTSSRTLVANFTAVPSGVTTLQNGVPVTGLAGATGNQKFYKITVPAGQTALSVRISGGTGDCDLYVRYGSLPTLTQYNARPYVSGNLELATLPLPAAGTWYIMLRGRSAYSGVSLEAQYGQDMLTSSLLSGLSGALGYRLDEKYSQGIKPLTYLTAGWEYGVQISVTVYIDLADYAQVTQEGWTGDWVTLWGRANASVGGSCALPVSLGVLQREFNTNSASMLPDRAFPLDTSIFGGSIGPVSLSGINTSDLSFSPVDFTWSGDTVELNACWWAFSITTPSVSVEVKRSVLDDTVANSVGAIPGRNLIQIVNFLKVNLISSAQSGSSIIWALPGVRPTTDQD
jgi:hypothetical protein